MYEVIAVAAGIALGVALKGDHGRAWLAAVIVGCAFVVGFAVSRIAGEGAELILWDAAQVAVAAVLTRVLVRRLVSGREAAARPPR